MSHWSLAVSFSELIVGLVVLAAAGWICWNIWRRSGRRKIVAWLEVLRFGLIALLVFTLLRPEVVQQLQRTDPPELVVLCDRSASMKTRDIISTNSVTSRADWLTRQREKRFWKPLEKTAKVTIEEFAAPTE